MSNLLDDILASATKMDRMWPLPEVDGFLLWPDEVEQLLQMIKTELPPTAADRAQDDIATFRCFAGVPIYVARDDADFDRIVQWARERKKRLGVLRGAQRQVTE